MQLLTEPVSRAKQGASQCKKDEPLFLYLLNILHMLHHKTSASNTKIITDAKYSETCAASTYRQRAIRRERCSREACQMRFQTEIPQANCLGVHKRLLQMNEVATA